MLDMRVPGSEVESSREMVSTSRVENRCFMFLGAGRIPEGGSSI